MAVDEAVQICQSVSSGNPRTVVLVYAATVAFFDCKVHGFEKPTVGGR